jgi:hypothetical protein
MSRGVQAAGLLQELVDASEFSAEHYHLSGRLPVPNLNPRAIWPELSLQVEGSQHAMAGNQETAILGWRLSPLDH